MNPGRKTTRRSGLIEGHRRPAAKRFPSEELKNRSRGTGAHPPTKTPLVPREEYTAQLEGLVEIVDLGGKPAFLLKVGTQLVAKPFVARDGVRYLPPPREQIPWLLPKEQEVQRWYRKDKDLDLYDALAKEYHPSISKLPTEAHYDLLAAHDLHTYCLEQVHYSPILIFDGPAEYGKTRTGKGCIHVDYHGFHTESLNEAYIFRMADRLTATIFLDVMDLWDKAIKARSEDILLKRYEKGAQVPRVLHPDAPAYQDIAYFDIFGPTIIATNESVSHLLATRALTIHMPYYEGTFTEPTPQLGLPYKERLVAFRARHMGHPLPDLPKPVPGRLGDIIQPLFQVLQLVRPDRSFALLEIVREQAEFRQDHASSSQEAEIVQALLGLAGHVQNGLLSVQDITVAYNGAHGRHLSERSMGWRLRKLGFPRASIGNNYAAISWDEEVIRRLGRRYGLLRETPERPETPATGNP